MNNFLISSLLLSGCGLTLCGSCVQAAAPAAAPGVPVASVVPLPAEKAGDIYLLPQGAGTRDGSSWKNALSSADGLQAAWDKLQPGQTLWIGSGTYPNAKLNINRGGAQGQMMTIAGRDTGDGLPLFVGDFDKSNPAKTGATFITLSNGADYWGVQDLRVRGCSNGLVSKAGGHEGARIRNFDVSQCREGISLSGGATVENPAAGSHDIEISDCDFVDFTKRGIRLQNGNYDFKISDCVADAGGKAWATEPFQMGFSVAGDDAARKAKREGAHDHDIAFTGCVAMGSYNDAGDKYWNADGFVAERGVKNLGFVNCAAFDNTDGGWDLKADEVTLTNCVAVGNKRNYRLWGRAKMTNCLAAYSVKPGGTGGDIGLWASGDVRVENSTFLDNGANIETDKDGKVTLVNSILAMSDARAGAVLEKAGVTLTDCVIWDAKAKGGENPQFVAPSARWDGQGDAFNNRKFGAGKGFFRAAKNSELPAFTRAHFVAPAAKVATNAAATDAATAPDEAMPDATGNAGAPTFENGGFEEGLRAWTKALAPVYAVQNEGGAQGQKFVRVTAGARRVEVYHLIGGLVTGEKYVLSYQSRGNTSPDARLVVRESATGKYLGTSKPASEAQWKTNALKFTATAPEMRLEISVRAAGTFDLDDFRIERAG